MCKHIYKRGANAGKQCENTGLHNGLCWKHKKEVVPDHITKEVEGSKDESGKDEKKAKPKFKFSAFRFTVNSNTSAATMSVENVRQFKDLISFIFHKDRVADYLIDKCDDDPRANLDELESAFFFEIAPGNHTLHAHGVVKLRHKGHYTLDIPAIREIVAGIIGKRVHINIQASGDADASWRQYIEKSQAAEKV